MQLNHLTLLSLVSFRRAGAKAIRYTVKPLLINLINLH